VPVIRQLQASDLPVLAPANPLRGLAHDAEYVASVVRQIDGRVLVVGHSYGGAVISVAGAAAANVVCLVSEPLEDLGERFALAEAARCLWGVDSFREIEGVVRRRYPSSSWRYGSRRERSIIRPR